MAERIEFEPSVPIVHSLAERSNSLVIVRYVGLREVDDSRCSSICSIERRASELRGQALNLEQPPRASQTSETPPLWGLRMRQSLFLTHLAANQLAGIVIILDDVDITALLGVVLHDRELAVPELLDGFGLAIKIVVVDLAGENSMRVFLHQIDLAVEIPIALDPDEFLVFVGFDHVWLPVPVRVDGYLVTVLVDPVYPLIGASVAASMRNRALGFSAARDEDESECCLEDCGFPHVSLYPSFNPLSTLLSGPNAGIARSSIGRYRTGARSDTYSTRHGTCAAGHEPAVTAH